MDLTLEGEVVISKTIAISKIVFQPFITIRKNILASLFRVYNTDGYSMEKLYP